MRILGDGQEWQEIKAAEAEEAALRREKRAGRGVLRAENSAPEPRPYGPAENPLLARALVLAKRETEVQRVRDEKQALFARRIFLVISLVFFVVVSLALADRLENQTEAHVEAIAALVVFAGAVAGVIAAWADSPWATMAAWGIAGAAAFYPALAALQKCYDIQGGLLC